MEAYFLQSSFVVIWHEMIASWLASLYILQVMKYSFSKAGLE